MNTKDQVVKNSGVGLKKLYMLSKVAERKERVSSSMRKNANEPNLGESDNTVVSGPGYSKSPYEFGKELINRDSEFHRLNDDLGEKQGKKSKIIEDFINSANSSGTNYDIFVTPFTNGVININSNESLSENNINKAIGYINDFVLRNPNLWSRFHSKSHESAVKLIGYLRSIDLSKYNKGANGEREKVGEPKQVTRRQTSSPNLSEITKLLIKAGYKDQINTNAGWNGLDAAFRNAVKEYVEKIQNNDVNLKDPWQWSDVAPQLRFPPDLSGAESLVQRLIELKSKSSTPAAAPTQGQAPSQPKPEAIDKGRVVAGLEVMFNNIASRAIKVDKRGLDFMRDSKNFRGVIRGLGGPNSAASYCVEKAGFSPEETRKIAEYSNKTAQELATFANESSEMLKVYNLFMSIKRDATRGFGRDRRGFTEDSLARSVARLMSERKPSSESETPAAASAADDGLSTQASIMRAIEIRKMAARKKLGI